MGYLSKSRAPGALLGRSKSNDNLYFADMGHLSKSWNTEFRDFLSGKGFFLTPMKLGVVRMTTVEFGTGVVRMTTEEFGAEGRQNDNRWVFEAE